MRRARSLYLMALSVLASPFGAETLHDTMDCDDEDSCASQLIEGRHLDTQQRGIPALSVHEVQHNSSIQTAQSFGMHAIARCIHVR
jgi:hypothetical protein